MYTRYAYTDAYRYAYTDMKVHNSTLLCTQKQMSL